MSNVSGPTGNAAAQGSHSVRLSAQVTSVEIKFNDGAEATRFNQELNKAALAALKSFGGGQPSNAPASSPGIAGNMPGVDMGAWQAKFNEAGEIGRTLDNMEGEAMRLLKSPKKEDQIKGQQMMQAMQSIMEAVMKAISARGEAMKTAIQNSVSR